MSAFTCLLAACSLVGCGQESAKPARNGGVRHVPSSQGQMSVSRMTHDFGLVHPGVVKTHRFIVANTSEMTWKLKEVRRQCSCTVARIPWKTLEPGSSGEVIVNYTPGDALRAVAESKTTTLAFESSETPEVELRILATVRPVRVVSPDRVQVTAGPDATNFTRLVRIDNFSGIPWRNVSASSDATWVDCSVRRVDGEAHDVLTESWLISLDLTPGQDGNVLQGNLAIDGAGDSPLDIPITVFASRTVSVTPERIFLGRVPAGQPVSVQLSIVLSSESSSPPVVTLQGNVRSLSKVSVKAKSARVHLVTMEVVAPELDSVVAGAMNVEVGEHAVQVPVSGIVVQQ